MPLRFLLVLLLCTPQAALAQSADDTEETEAWDVAAPPGEISRASIDVREGTWMSLDVSPDGKTIAFDLLGDIYVLPMAGGEARALTSGPAWDFQPRFSPDGAAIAFTSDRGGAENIWIMDADGSEPRQVTTEQFRLLNNAAWSPDGRFLVARKHFTTRRSLGTGEIWLYHRDGGAGVQLVERPNEAYQKELGEPIFSPDGRYIYFTQNATSGNRFIYAQDSNTAIFKIRRFDMERRKLDDFITGPGGAVRPTPSPDGKYLAFVRRIRTRSALFLKDLASGAEFPIYEDLDQDMQETWGVQGLYPNMDWTPDSEAIVFWAGGKIRRIDIASRTVNEIPFHVSGERRVVDAPRFTTEVAPETVEAKMIRFAAISPDGRRAVFEAFGRLWIKALPDGAAQRLTRDAADHFELFPAFSRDGERIVFVSWDDEALGQVRVVDAGGGRSRVISPEPGHYFHPRYSPDGSTVVVERGTGGMLTSDEWSIDPGLYALPADGGGLTRLSDSGRNAHFGADGERVFYIEDGDKHRLVSVESDGDDKRVHAESEYGTDFAVSPSGDWLAFSQSYDVFVMPMPASGKLALSPDAKALPMVRVNGPGGDFPRWAGGDTLSWTTGPTLYRVDAAEAFEEGFEPPEVGIDLSVTRPAAKPEGSLVALTGARVIPMEGEGRVIENGVVIVEDNRISAVGSAGEVAIPAGAARVDASGKTILPGFIDIHAHGAQGVRGIIPEQNWGALAHLALGVTTVHDPSNRAGEIFAAAEYQRSGEILAPRIFSTGEILYGAKSEFFVDIDSLEDARHAVERLKAQGAISVKNYNQPRREQRQMVVAAAREAGLNVVAEGGSLYHMDMTLIADGNTGVEHNVPQERLYEDVLQFWSQTQVGNTPTLVVTYGGLNGETYFYQQGDVWKHPILSRFVPPHVLEPRSVRRTKAPDLDYRHLIDAAANARRLMERGVSIHVGAHGQREGLGTHWDIWAFAMGGMSPYEALMTATINPARYMGLEADIGSIAPGKLADLVILEGDPLADIRMSDDIAQVMLGGRLYDAATLDETVTGDHETQPFYWESR